MHFDDLAAFFVLLSAFMTIVFPISMYLSLKMATMGYWSGWSFAVRAGITPYIFHKNEEQK